MRVAILTVNAGRGGVVNVVWQIARALHERPDCEVLVACDSGSELDSLEELGISHALVPFSQGTRSFFAARSALKSAFRDFRPDVIHSHSRWPSMVAFSLGRQPDVSTLHSDRITSHGSAWDVGLLRRRFSVWGRIVTTPGEAGRKVLIREAGLLKSRITVVPNGVNPAKFNPASTEQRTSSRRSFGLNASDTVGLFVGAMMTCKRPEQCIDSLAFAVSSGIDSAKLLLVGDGVRRSATEQRARDLGVYRRCVFTGWIDPIPAYHAADFLLLPSEVEGFALVAVEAMLSGLPVIRTRCGGCEEQIVEGETGWSCEVGDDRAFCDLVAAAMVDPGLLHQMGHHARKRALDRFTEQHFVEAMFALYQQTNYLRSR